MVIRSFFSLIIYIKMKRNINKLIYYSIVIIIPILSFFFILYWGDYLLKNNYIQKEGFAVSPSGETHTVNLPINTTTSCKNMCGPPGRCSITGEQCVSDIDCYGCQQLNSSQKITQDVRGDNDAGKLTDGVTPTYSTLTTDIGTRAKFFNKNAKVPQYDMGMNTWRSQYDLGQELFDKRYNSSHYTNQMNYQERPTLSGQFMIKGPLPANDYM